MAHCKEGRRRCLLDNVFDTLGNPRLFVERNGVLPGCFGQEGTDDACVTFGDHPAEHLKEKKFDPERLFGGWLYNNKPKSPKVGPGKLCKVVKDVLLFTAPTCLAVSEKTAAHSELSFGKGQ